MASISVSEETFTALADAAHLALKLGNRPLAAKLDRLARMANAALASQRPSPLRSLRAKPLSWRDVPSVFNPVQRPPK
jgi:hypothetical protein